MKKIAENIFVKLFLYITVIVFGMTINFVMHEFSHLFMLWVCNGNMLDFSLFNTMFVSGSVAYNHISTVALGSIFIPFIISTIISFLKNKWIVMFNMGFTVPVIMNIILGFFATFFIKDVAIQNTYDLALACNFIKYKWIVLLLCGIILIITLMIIWNGFEKIKEKI